jgi:hypothetical protein
VTLLTFRTPRGICVACNASFQRFSPDGIAFLIFVRVNDAMGRVTHGKHHRAPNIPLHPLPRPLSWVQLQSHIKGVVYNLTGRIFA